MTLTRKQLLATTQPMTQVQPPFAGINGKWRVLGFRKNPRYPEFSVFEQEPWEENFATEEQATAYYNKMLDKEA
jgi:hypothetical protein